MSFLKLDNLSKQYGGATAVDGVSFSASQGEFISLLGPSGCGKTTTLQMIAGFVDPTSGTISLDGRDLSKINANERGLGVVFQSYALFPHMSVSENVKFGLEMRKVKGEVQTKKIADILELMHLGPMKDRLPSQLSGGQRQRVALARALVIEPPILLLDEPLSNLDAKLREDMQTELRRVQRSFGTTTIMVTHDQAEAMAISDRIVVLDRGRIEQIGQPHEVYENPASPFVATFLGKANLLKGRHRSNADGSASLVVNSVVLPLPNGRFENGSEVSVSLRPEKMWLKSGSQASGALVLAKVHMRTFCGDHWIYELDSPLGQLLARSQNDGKHYNEGDSVAVGWEPEDMKVIGGRYV